MDDLLLQAGAGVSNVAPSDVGADPKSALIKRIEQSFQPLAQPPENIEEARSLAERLLRAVPGCESLRMRTLADAIAVQPEVVHDRVYGAIATAATAFGVSPGVLVQQIERTRTTVGVLMSQSGKR